jgi:hypothetical protein
VLRFDNRSKIIISLGEDALEVMEQFVFKNVSEKIFDPGQAGLLVPLPERAESAKEIEGGLPLEVRGGQGVVIQAAIPPNRAAVFAQQIRVGFFLLARGSSRVDLHQPLPFGLEGPFIIVPAGANLTLSAPGMRALPDRNDGSGNPVKVYELSDIQPGGVLDLRITGLPALGRGGRNFAAGLCVLLIIGAVIGSRRPPAADKAQAEAEKLAERREKLFAELVALERTRRQRDGDADAGPAARNGELQARRQELVGKLETIYRDLARTEGDHPAP